jgi:hypothetical protein
VNPDRLSRVRLLVLTSAVLGLFVSCEHSPTDGGTSATKLRNTLVRTPPSVTYVTIGSFQVGGVHPSGYTTDHSSPGPTLPNKKILYRLTASGTVTPTRTQFWDTWAGWPAEQPYGPSGFGIGSSCYAFMYVGSSSFYGGETWYAPSCYSGTPPLPTEVTSHVYLAGATSINRATSPLGGQWDCYKPGVGYGPCFSWSDDGQEITIDRVVATLTVTAAPQTVNYRDSVIITASVSPGEVASKRYPGVSTQPRGHPRSERRSHPAKRVNSSHFIPDPLESASDHSPDQER